MLVPIQMQGDDPIMLFDDVPLGVMRAIGVFMLIGELPDNDRLAYGDEVAQWVTKGNAANDPVTA